MRSTILIITLAACSGCAATPPPTHASRLELTTSHAGVAKRPPAPPLLVGKTMNERKTMIGETPWKRLTRPYIEPPAAPAKPAQPTPEAKFIDEL
jgi:hypothetical protein